jgi:Fur family peroxide stress response transcriptional regulator
MDSTDFEARLEHFVSTVKQAGIKMTNQRLEIIKAIIQSEDHPDAEGLLSKLRDRLPLISIDTIYRSLWLLAELELITTLGNRSDSIRFDGNMKPHHHFVCKHCGAVQDFYNEAFDQLSTTVRDLNLGTVLSSQVEIRGICTNCLSSATAPDRPQAAEN